MSLFIFLTVVQAIVAAALVGVVLMQRSEGGGLGIGGSPGGALGARGAADFLTRSTKWLAVLFVGLSILLAALAVETSSVDTVTTTLERKVGGNSATDLGGQGGGNGAGAPASDPAGAESGNAPADPLAEPQAAPGAAPGAEVPAGDGAAPGAATGDGAGAKAGVEADPLAP